MNATDPALEVDLQRYDASINLTKQTLKTLNALIRKWRINHFKKPKSPADKFVQPKVLFDADFEVDLMSANGP
jgi:hypothetical protein